MEEEKVDIGRNQPLEVVFPLRERGFEQLCEMVRMRQVSRWRSKDEGCGKEGE